MSRVAVVGGGTSPEHAVSLASAAAAVSALASAGHEPVPLTIDRDGCWLDRGRRPLGLAGAVHVLRSCDVVLPMLHGRGGEDGALAALCDLAAVPVVGSPLAAAATAMDKWLTKLVAAAIGVDVAPGRLLGRAEDHGPAAELLAQGPVVVKPVGAGSSLGVARVDHVADLPGALAAAFALDDRVLVEQVVVGREVDVAVLGRPDGSREVPPLLEIRPPEDAAPGVFDHATKYDGSARFLVPAPLTPAESAALRAAAVRVYDALGCRGLARVDFFLTDAGPVLNEVNTIPGFTPHSQAPLMFAAGGLSYPDLVDRMVRDAVPGARRPHRAARTVTPA
ncbi:D-alanine--D-alanine ligase [Nocardioides sp.]|uniref:D-alanine--D-alanine ligase family protein n=1 Tax=Nocardioides sp. TaxID=35761 RepID=UPI00351604EF